MKYADMAKLVYALSSDGSGYKPCGFKSHYLHHLCSTKRLQTKKSSKTYGFWAFFSGFMAILKKLASSKWV